METNTTKETLIEEVQCPKCGGSGIQGVGGNEEEGYHRIRCDVCYHSGLASDITLEEIEDLIDQAHTAGRNAEREELREWVEGKKEELVSIEKAKEDSIFSGEKKLLTDIINHLTE